MSRIEELVDEVLEEAARDGLACYVEGRENARGVADLLVARLRSEGLLREGGLRERMLAAGVDVVVDPAVPEGEVRILAVGTCERPVNLEGFGSVCGAPVPRERCPFTVEGCSYAG